MSGSRYIPYTITPPAIYARFVSFRTQGRVNAKVGDFTLGIGQSTSAALGNYVELRFDIITDAFEEYRIRRWIDDEQLWQRVRGKFTRTHVIGSRDDTPLTFSARQFMPPDIYDYDSPGIPLLERVNRSLVIQRGSVRTDINASEFLWIINFRDWVEGRRGEDWQRISLFTPWTSVFSATWEGSNAGRWVAGPQGSASTGRTRGDAHQGEVRLLRTSY